MASSTQSSKSPSKHYLEQQQRWKILHKHLKSLKDDKELGITYTDIAKGLGLSRQRLFHFLKTPEKGLPIDRYNILELWDYLTEPTDKDGNTSSKLRASRNWLRAQNSHILDDLLEAAGFLPKPQKSEPLVLPIERIKSRLLGPWIRNDTMLCRLADTIIDTILDQGGFDESKEGSLGEQGLKLNEARELPNQLFNAVEFSKIEQLFHQELDRFATLGKVWFYNDELYELYQSLLENHTYKSFPADMQAIKCDFRTLSFELIDTKTDKQLAQEITTICNECEKQLRIGLSANTQHFFPPIIEVTARFVIDDKHEPQEVIFSYSCCSTHFEAAMVALSNGLGYLLSSALYMTGFFVRAIGKRSESLARVSITLTEENNNSLKTSSNNYQGIWVDQNVILGILNSMTYAALNWLAKRLGNKDFEVFYSICKESSKIKKNLYKSLEYTYNYRSPEVYPPYISKSQELDEQSPDILEESVDKSVNRLVEEIEILRKKSIKNIQSIDSPEKSLDESTALYFDCYRGRLKQKALLAQLATARSALFRCDLTTAKKVIEELENKIRIERYGKAKIEDSSPITILYESEKMLYMLLTGNAQFWNSPELQGEALSQKLKTVTQNLGDYAIKHNDGILDFDIYLAAGQFFGVVGLAKFYFCTQDNYKDLEDALTYMIKAAHYSAKLGHHQRVFRCLCYASRICCRLGKQTKAQELTKLVKNLFQKQQGASFTFNSYNAQDYLAKGEQLLLFKDISYPETGIIKALKYFLTAWQKADNCKFDRAFVSSLYNVTRALDQLKESIPKKRLDLLIKELSNQEDFEKGDGNINCQDIFESLIKKDLTFKDSDLSKTNSIDLLSEQLKKIVIEKLNKWKRDSGQNTHHHPFSEMIQQGIFLNRLQ